MVFEGSNLQTIGGGGGYYINYGCFQNCSALTSIAIPNSVTNLFNGQFGGNSGTFESCSNLTNVTIGTEVASIPIRTFFGTPINISVTFQNTTTIPTLTNIFGNTSTTQGTAYYLPSVTTNLSQLPEYFTNVITSINGVIYTVSNSKAFVSGYTTGLPSSVTLLSSVTLSETTYPVTSIGNNAFLNCSALTYITIPSSITSIGSNGFEGTPTSISVTFQNPNTIPTLTTPFGPSVTQGTAYYLSSVTTNLTELTQYFTNVTTSETLNDVVYTFYNGNVFVSGYTSALPSSVTLLSSVTFSGTIYPVTSIGNNAFLNCSTLTSIIIPSNIASIGSNGFQGTPTSISVTFQNNIPTLTNIFGYPPNNTKQGTAYYLSSGATNSSQLPEYFTNVITSINGVIYTVSNSNAFVSGYTTGLQSSVALQSSLTLSTTTYPVTSIGNNAFLNCSALTYITIPSSITSIGSNGFQGTPTSISVTFQNIKTIPTLTTPFGYSSETTTKQGTAYYLSSVENGVSQLPEYFTNVITSETVNGVVYTLFTTNDQAYVSGYVDALPSSVTLLSSVTLSGSTYPVTSIGNNAFLSSTTLTSIIIPSSITSIGSNGFQGTPASISVTFQNTTTIPTLTNPFGTSSTPSTQSSAIIQGTAYYLSTVTQNLQQLAEYFTNVTPIYPPVPPPIPPIPIPISNVCFFGNTPINTDQGIILIKNIKPRIHTIRNEQIVAITKTQTLDTYLVCFKKNSLNENYPSENTIVTKDHKIYYNGRMIAANYFIKNNKNVLKVKYNGEILYNILMKKHSLVRVNNLICETLHPENIISKIYKNNYMKNKHILVQKINDLALQKRNNENNIKNKKIRMIQF